MNLSCIARSLSRVVVVLVFACALVMVPGCGGGSSDEAGAIGFPGFGGVDQGTASGAKFKPVKKVHVPDISGLTPMTIDVSTVNDGYVSVSAESAARLKFQVTNGDMTYNYDLPNDGTPAMYPINMGDGSYLFRIMQNTEGSNYVELDCTYADVALSSEFAPFLVPNYFCKYNGKSEAIAKARELVGSATNEGEALCAICAFVIDNISYDNAKAEKLATTAGYVPDPDETLATKTGICFDYSSLAAAMLRSQGIPTKIITGYVDPNNIYHAWIMVYIDGTWKTAQFDVTSKTWSRVDTTFASTGGSSFVGEGVGYTDRYVY
ncbi:MAG: transglutaminase-like domain-containing protein [Coriobacteriia bacterium]|nr:transglutaminase-like domain-containing protein [Coriobacteriia bacterium]